MKLFDDKKRTDSKYANHLDNIYDFYDRSCLNQSEQIRDLLNNWFCNYPDSEKYELKARFKKTFSHAFFELFLYELFTKQGFTLKPHPKIIGTSNQPDFLVKGNGLEFYLEAKESTDKSKADTSFENKIGQFYDILNKTNSPNFFFDVNELSLKSNKQPSGKDVVKFLEKELTKYDPDELNDELKENKFDNLHRIEYEDDDLKLIITLIPKSIEARGKKELRPIGIYPISTYWGGSTSSIKSSIKKKATRYGEIDKPFLICINSTSEKGTDEDDIMNVLFGSLQVTFSTNPNNRNKRSTRALDGVFLDSNGPKNTRVSGIFITHVNPANLDIAKHWLVKHPYASKELNFSALKLSTIVVEDGKIKKIDGSTIKEIIGLPDDWLNLKL